MKPISGPAPLAAIEADFWRELAEIEAESIGWHALDDGAYLHIGSDHPRGRDHGHGHRSHGRGQCAVGGVSPLCGFSGSCQ
jgi:hypothetical protein